ncbi:MAG: HAMP domain-containing histidine kinase [Chloroflexi bacterium]|nr:HAMP domain-containing histidine kinase [Chloroflexota bacterium]
MAEEELRRLRGELRRCRERTRELEDGIAAISHDLRSPLTNIDGFTRLLDHAVLQFRTLLDQAEIPASEHGRLSRTVSEIPEYLEYTLGGVQRMNSMISQLVRLSRIGATIELTRLDMNRLLAEVARDFEHRIRMTGVSLELPYLPACTGDAFEIGRLFSNLLDNALKCLDPAKERGLIRIAGRRIKQRAIYCMEDNGTGMTEEQQEQVREFLRGPELLPKGMSGMGLAIAKKIVKAHGGRIWFWAAPGIGCRFCVSLPG